uniref:Uncharacterized protein n=1 Tax=Glossina brevipalpis TaxID=37001 RepID=A0A1A9WNI3_9MUSC
MISVCGMSSLLSIFIIFGAGGGTSSSSSLFSHCFDSLLTLTLTAAAAAESKSCLQTAQSVRFLILRFWAGAENIKAILRVIWEIEDIYYTHKVLNEFYYDYKKLKLLTLKRLNVLKHLPHTCSTISSVFSLTPPCISSGSSSSVKQHDSEGFSLSVFLMGMFGMEIALINTSTPSSRWIAVFSLFQISLFSISFSITWLSNTDCSVNSSILMRVNWKSSKLQYLLLTVNGSILMHCSMELPVAVSSLALSKVVAAASCSVISALTKLVAGGLSIVGLMLSEFLENTLLLYKFAASLEVFLNVMIGLEKGFEIFNGSFYSFSRMKNKNPIINPYIDPSKFFFAVIIING